MDEKSRKKDFMMPHPEQSLRIYILVHNELRHIVRTIAGFHSGCVNAECQIKVYPNGCVDNTWFIVHQSSQHIPMDS